MAAAKVMTSFAELKVQAAGGTPAACAWKSLTAATAFIWKPFCLLREVLEL